MGVFRDSLSESGAYQKTWSAQPTVQFPVTLAIAQVQSNYNYYQKTSGYSVQNSISEMQTSYDELLSLQGIVGVVPVSKLLVAGHHQSADALRKAASSLKAEMLYVYTLDTQFDETDWSSALSLYSLGLSPTVTVEVMTTAMGVLIDTRTGYVYGVVEASSYKDQKAAYMTRQNAWDQCRKVTEQEAFKQMNVRFKTMWNGIISQYGQGTVRSNAPKYREDKKISDNPASIVKDNKLESTSEAEGQLFWQ